MPAASVHPDLVELEGGSALVELSEILDVDGVRTEFPEALVFDFAPDGRIQRVDVFIKQPPSRRKEGA